MIKNQKKITFINDCNVVVDYSELEKAVLWYAAHPVQSEKHIYMHGEYPAVSIGKSKLHIHRLLMMFWLNCIIPSSFCVHHIDGNKMNAQMNNLAVVNVSIHQSAHNKGKKLSESHKQKIRESNHLRKGKRHKYKINVSPKTVFELKNNGYSFNQISKMLNLDWGCVRQRYQDYIHDNPELLEVTK